MNHENPQFLVVDLFCGAGGTTIGFDESGTSLVIAAINHDPEAIQSHWQNHPEVHHFEEDIRTLELSPLVSLVLAARHNHPEAKLVLWASLECTNFSNAKGGAPRDADSRTLAHHLHRYIEAINPDYVMIENVIEFMAWGPLCENGKPISRKNGSEWLSWCSEVRKHGYRDEWKQLNSADFGARTSRNRLFGCFHKPELPFTWPQPTHAKTPQLGSLFGEPLKKWLPCKPCLDLNDHGTSIFTPNRIKSDKTFTRILSGLTKYIGETTMKEFMFTYYGNLKSGYHSVDEPCPTLTTKDRAAKVFIDKYYTGHHNHQGVDEPAHTLTGNPKLNLVTPIVIDTQFNNEPKSVDEPLGVITTNRKWHYLMNPQYYNDFRELTRPSFTLIARMDKAPPQLVSIEGGHVSIVVNDDDSDTVRAIKYFMAVHGIIDIKMRMLNITELKKIQGFPSDYTLTGSQAAQKKFIGNSVVPQVVTAWVMAISNRLNQTRKAA